MGDLGVVARVLEKAYIPLAHAIQYPASIPIREPPYPYLKETKVEPVKMLPEEVWGWDRVFGISEILKDEKGVVGVATDVMLADLDKITYAAEMDAIGRKNGLRGEVHDSVLFAGKYTKFFPFNIEGAEWYIRPHFQIERTKNGRGIVSASLRLRIYAKDKDGRLAVAYPKPIRQGFPRYDDAIFPGAIVSPYEPIDARLSFNTTLNPNGQNKLEIDLNNHRRLLMRAELHGGEQIGQIHIPDDYRVEVFFGQVDRFLVKNSRARLIFNQIIRALWSRDYGRTIDNLFQTEGRSR